MSDGHGMLGRAKLVDSDTGVAPPVVDGRWEGFHLRHELSDAVELNEGSLIQHCITLNIGGPTRFEMQVYDSTRWSATGCPMGMTILPSGSQVRTRILDPYEALTLSIDPQRLLNKEKGAGSDKDLEPSCNICSPLIAQLMLALYADARTGHAEGPTYGETLLLALTTHLVQTHTAAKDKLKAPGKLSKLSLRRVKDHVNGHIESGVSLTALADSLDMDPYTFLRSFKRSTGMTPHQYMIRARIDHAKDMLHFTRLSITEIALRTGFSSPSHFADTFKKFEQRTALEYRNRCSV